MARRIRDVGLVWTVVFLAAAALPESATVVAEREVVEVRMVDVSPTRFAFEPSEIEVEPGDRIRFVQAGVMPHNVEFRKTPKGVDLGDVAMGPFLTAKGQTYEIVVDDRFGVGEYDFVCTPHAALGMTGTLKVAGSRREEGA